MEEIMKIIPKSDYTALYRIVNEYLPGTKKAVLDDICVRFPSAVSGYYHENKLIGVCYGFEIDPEHFILDGIAVVEPYNASGRGGRLIAFFERRISLLGYKSISLGSADGYVEKFYLKNGYTPVSLKIYVDHAEWPQKSVNYMYPVAYTQTEGAYTKLVMTVTDYGSMHKEDIMAYYNGRHSFFVFEKQL